MTYPSEQSSLKDHLDISVPKNDLSLLAAVSSPFSYAGPQNEQVHTGKTDSGLPEKNSASPKQSPESWTYVVNLTATLFPALGTGSEGAGAGNKYSELMKLKELTKNSNSEVIVQEFDSTTAMLKRFELSHGQIHEFTPIKSSGNADDLQKLLSMAPKTGHLALIQEAHGQGDLGFDTDAGVFAVADFTQAVKKGLRETGRSSLDMLSMDSCLMANIQVLAKMSGLADKVVASELEEFSSVELSHSPPITQFDMQPISKYLEALLKKPPKDGEEAAETVVSVSAKSCSLETPKWQTCGTPTLGIYDPAVAPEAEKALNQFGVALQEAAKNPATERAIDSLIDQLPDMSEVADHLRDVDKFANGVVSLINKGVISDPFYHVLNAAQNVLSTDRRLMSNFYLNPEARIVKIVGKGNLTGLNTFLPGTNFDVVSEAENVMSENSAKLIPRRTLLDAEIKRSLPDAYPSGWSSFIKAIRSK